MSLLEAVCAFARHDVQRQILSSTVRAKKALGFDAQPERSALAALTYAGPTFVASVRLVGEIELPMDDSDPFDSGTFVSARSVTVGLPASSLQRAKERITPTLLDAEWFSQSFHWTHGFARLIGSRIRRVELLDCLGGIVAEGSVAEDLQVAWLPVAVHGDLEREELNARQQAVHLHAVASSEAAWDNHWSARTIRDAAKTVVRPVAIARNRLQLVK
jgi:hypothetical protein